MDVSCAPEAAGGAKSDPSGPHVEFHSAPSIVRHQFIRREHEALSAKAIVTLLREVNARCFDRANTSLVSACEASGRGSWRKPVIGKSQPRLHDPDWSSLLDAEQQFEAQIAAAEKLARERVAQARATAACAVPDAGAAGTLAAAQEQTDVARQRDELARIDEQADHRVRALAQVPDALIDTLARLALDAVLDEAASVQRR
jgi:hypothetical protein